MSDLLSSAWPARAPRAVLALLAAVVATLMYAGSAQAAPWCGSVTIADRPAIAGGNAVEVIYAIPADGVDQSAQRAPGISADVDSITAWWHGQDYARAPRFDLTTFPCGAQADIVLARLPQSGGDLRPSTGRFSTIAATVARIGLRPQSTKYLVYYDGPVEDDHLCGQGGGSAGGTGVAIIYTAACTDIPTNVVGVHELIHALGALPSPGPPHACPGSPGHACDSSGDVMYPYAPQARLDVLALDLGRNDYYAHSGTWPDLQDSAWLRHLEAPPAVLTVTPTTGGSVQSADAFLDCALACSLEWDAGTKISLQATPAAGQKLVRWAGACSGQGTCEVTLSQATAVQAVFGPAAFRLTVSRTGKGIVRTTGGEIQCPGQCAGSVDSFAPVTLKAVPVAGWLFKRWTGACRGAALTCKVPMSANAGVQAVFVKKAVPIKKAKPVKKK